MARPSMRSMARLARAALFLILASVAAGAAATPMIVGGSGVEPPKWPKGAKLSVCIQKDPKGLGRDELAKAGVGRWAKTLSDRGRTLEVTIVDKIEECKDKIVYTWDPDGPVGDDGELGPGPKDQGAAGPKKSADGKTIVGGEAHLRNALPAGTDKEKFRIKNLAEHEFLHILNLADGKGVISDHEQIDIEREDDPEAQSINFNEDDLKELNMVLGTAQSGGDTQPEGLVTPEAPGADPTIFRYRLDFLAANAVADPADPEHVALINLGIDPSLVVGLDLPPGWIGIIPGTSVSPDDPFFADYMVDGYTDPAPWSATNPMRYIALRKSDAEAAADGLPADFDPALTLLNPSFLVTVYTVENVTLGLVDVWAGGEVRRVLGPVPIPAPATLALLLAGAAGFMRRGRSLT